MVNVSMYKAINGDVFEDKDRCVETDKRLIDNWCSRRLDNGTRFESLGGLFKAGYEEVLWTVLIRDELDKQMYEYLTRNEVKIGEERVMGYNDGVYYDYGTVVEMVGNAVCDLLYMLKGNGVSFDKVW